MTLQEQEIPQLLEWAAQESMTRQVGHTSGFNPTWPNKGKLPGVLARLTEAAVQYPDNMALHTAIVRTLLLFGRQQRNEEALEHSLKLMEFEPNDEMVQLLIDTANQLRLPHEEIVKKLISRAHHDLEEFETGHVPTDEKAYAESHAAVMYSQRLVELEPQNPNFRDLLILTLDETDSTRDKIIVAEREARTAIPEYISPFERQRGTHYHQEQHPTLDV